MINSKNASGFTLIELMITVAIVGILAAIALPSYQNNILKSRRADAKRDLMGLANAMERHFTVVNTYCGSDKDPDCTMDSIYKPNPNNANFYTIAINIATDTEFTLTAEPIGAQADDPCGTFSLTQNDTRTTSNTVDGCW